MAFDQKILKVFLEKQSQLFDEPVATTAGEAAQFLEEVFAVVASNAAEVKEYFEEEGIDMESVEGKNILDADEVFAIGDGRYLIVPG